MVFEDCTICLDEMHQSDFDHPLQCDTHCGYNFCKNCIASLITSSKDDYMEASDGNRHVKVFLHCPSCRADLSHTIRDTLLLRKADAVLSGEEDMNLSASLLRLKDDIDQPRVQAAISEARRLEAAFLGRDYVVDVVEEQEQYFSDEEEGVEMDLVRGVHQSFHTPRGPPPTIQNNKAATTVDPSLFAGLDYFLSDDERLYVTDLMTTGESRELAEAAHILYSVAQISKEPKQKCKMPRISSVSQLIAESEEAHHIHDIKMIEKVIGNVNVFRPAETKVAQHRILERDLKKQALFQQLFPVPVRMPKCIEIDLQGIFELRFVVNEWNGTVMDAYSKISIGYSGAVTQKRTTNRGVRTVLGESDSDIQIELPGQRRVLISYAGRDAGKQGAVKGDVVTHINGDSVEGKDADSLLILINNAKQRGEEKIMMTLNAERSVAEALKRRAMAIHESW